MRTFLIVLFILPFGLKAQKEVNVGGMTLSYIVDHENIQIQLEAPTTGWVGVGFNTENRIVHSDLLLFHVLEHNKAEYLDMCVAGIGDPRTDISMGGSSDIHLLSASESLNNTSVKFEILLNGKDPYDFSHQLDQEFWLILAYSTHDDFGHHSRMRKHIPFRFEE